MAPDEAPLEWRDAGEDDLFEMANFYPRDTGLPMTVWVSVKGNAWQDARIKVCMTPGDRMDADNTAVVAIRPGPRLLHGDLSPRDVEAVKQWVVRNSNVLIDYWDGRASTVGLVRRLKKLAG
jgi:hypothetical protein